MQTCSSNKRCIIRRKDQSVSLLKHCSVAARFRISPVQTAPLCCALLTLAASFLLTPQANAAAISDANWVSMGGIPGVDGQVNAVAVDGSGNLYIGGRFSIIHRQMEWDYLGGARVRHEQQRLCAGGVRQ